MGVPKRLTEMQQKFANLLVTNEGRKTAYECAIEAGYEKDRARITASELQNPKKFPFVEIEWLDIEGDAGWSDTKSLNKEKLPTCVSKGYLVSQQGGVTRIFTDYIKSKDKPTFDSIGNTTIIPTAVIESIKKLN